MLAHPAGESDSDVLRLAFDRRLKLEFHGSSVTSDAGLLAYRELDDVLGLTALAGSMLSDGRRGKNTRHLLTGLLRQSVFGRLAGYEDVNDAERLARDPAMRWIVGGHAVAKQAASASQIGRFETEWLTRRDNLSSLGDLGGLWIDRVHGRRPPKAVVLDMDSSVSPTYGEQEGAAYNGHFGCTCYHPLFVFNQFGDLERCALRSGNVHSADGWHDVLEPVLARYRNKISGATSGPMPPSPTQRSTNIWKRKDSSTRFASPPIRCFRSTSLICLSVRLDDRHTKSGASMPTSAIGRKAGRSHVALSPRSSGTPPSFIPVSASS
jgi:hypothetical protein